MDTTYAPQSPDLSSFLSSPSKTQQSYHPHSPTFPSFNSPNPAQPQAAPTSTYNHPAPPTAFPQTIQQSHLPRNALYAYNPPLPAGLGFGVDDFDNQYRIPALPTSHTFHSQLPPPTTDSIPTFYTPQQASFAQDYHSTYNPPAPHQSSDSAYPSTDSPSSPPFQPKQTANMSRQPRAPKPLSSSNEPPQYKDPNPNNIEIRTKFPVARIKRIMQADEEVGKVAQVTPVAVSKALELFMIALVTGAAEKAKEKGGKRVTAQHLKAVVLGAPDQFDFLAEIVGRVAEVTEGAGGEGRKKKREKSESDSEVEEEKAVKKKGKGGRRKKKVEGEAGGM